MQFKHDGPPASVSSGVSLLHIMRAFILALLFLPVVTFADEVRVAVGQSRDELIATIKKHGATDITPGMEVVGPKGEHPISGVVWQFADYDAVIWLSFRDGTVVHMTYWTKKDFGESKSHRAKTEQSITALKLDTKTRAVSIEKTKKQANTPKECRERGGEESRRVGFRR